MMSMRCVFWSLIICLSACGISHQSSLPETDFIGLNGEKISLNDQESQAFKVFMFLTYDCPLSISYSGPMNQLVSEAADEPVDFYYVFPGLAFPDDSVSAFAAKYRLNAKIIFDPELKLTKSLEATVTPQVIILDSCHTISYSGAFDDWAFEPGRKRQVINRHYVIDALARLLEGNKPDPAVTEPVGCFIEL